MVTLGGRRAHFDQLSNTTLFESFVYNDVCVGWIRIHPLLSSKLKRWLQRLGIAQTGATISERFVHLHDRRNNLRGWGVGSQCSALMQDTNDTIVRVASVTVRSKLPQIQISSNLIEACLATSTILK